MTPTDYATKLVREFEGLRLKAYLDTGGVPTIGYGTTGPDIRMGMEWTQAQAEARQEADLAKFLAGVALLVTVPLTANQLGALGSFAYNVGIGAFKGSTLRRKLNKGDNAGAAEQFGLWIHDDGKVLPGLVRRRAAERQVFLNNPANFDNVVGGSSSTETET